MASDTTALLGTILGVDGRLLLVGTSDSVTKILDDKSWVVLLWILWEVWEEEGRWLVVSIFFEVTGTGLDLSICFSVVDEVWSWWLVVSVFSEVSGSEELELWASLWTVVVGTEVEDGNWLEVSDFSWRVLLLLRIVDDERGRLLLVVLTFSGVSGCGLEILISCWARLLEGNSEVEGRMLVVSVSTLSEVVGNGLELFASSRVVLLGTVEGDGCWLVLIWTFSNVVLSVGFWVVLLRIVEEGKRWLVLILTFSEVLLWTVEDDDGRLEVVSSSFTVELLLLSVTTTLSSLIRAGVDGNELDVSIFTRVCPLLVVRLSSEFSSVDEEDTWILKVFKTPPNVVVSGFWLEEGLGLLSPNPSS